MSEETERDRKMAYDAHELGIKVRERAMIDGDRVTIARADFEQLLVAVPLLAGWILAKLSQSEKP